MIDFFLMLILWIFFYFGQHWRLDLFLSGWMWNMYGV